MTKKKQFGKGLRALLENIETDANEVSSVNEEIYQKTHSSKIWVDKIEANPFQPRHEFEADALKSLAESISIHGVIQPITVRTLAKNKYQLISGERRLRAAKLAGLKEIPAYIRKADDQGMLELALIENTQRSDLNAIEVALSLKRLLDECKLTHDELSTRVSKNRSTITNYVRLLKLPPTIQQGLKDQKISMGQARSLISIENTEVQLDLFKKIVDKGLSVRAVEKIVRKLSNIENSKNSDLSGAIKLHPEVRKIQDNLSEYFGSVVKIQRNQKGKGQIIIRFNSDNEFNDIVERLEE
jgi:ParB family chromosome partitioning protein